MATIPQIFGTQALSGAANSLSSGITALGTKQILVIAWEDLDDFLTSSIGATPNTGEDWLAAMMYRLVDSLPAISTNNRNVAVVDQGFQVDQGFFRTGINLTAYSLGVSLYTTNTIANRPSASDL